MAQATFSVRMDEALKQQFDGLCREFGMTASTAFNVFAKAVVRQRKIPFEIAADREEAPPQLDAGRMSDRQLRAALEAGYRDFQDGQVENAASAFEAFREAHP